MHETRVDPLSDTRVLYASNRHPCVVPLVVTPVETPETCPFCPGEERQTPATLLALPGFDDWQVRVFTNKFPAIECPHGGRHEVVVESPDHQIAPQRLPGEDYEKIFQCYQRRLEQLSGDRSLRSAIIFKNHGRLAGASQDHPHSQIVALPWLVPQLALEIRRAEKLGGMGCFFCDEIEKAATDGRLVSETALVVAFCPYASRFACETWVLPKSHSSHFDRSEPELVADTARVTRQMIRRIDEVLNYPPYNYYLHMAGFDSSEVPYYHWHVEIAPRLSRVAGFELASGLFVNTLPPERAAALLRSVGEKDTTEELS